jgi:hypothetical protein
MSNKYSYILSEIQENPLSGKKVSQQLFENKQLIEKLKDFGFISECWGWYIWTNRAERMAGNPNKK